MTIKEYLKEHIICLDGGMGTLLQESGLAVGELPERLNISSPELITKIHRAYYEAGSNVVLANTFGANSLKFSSSELDALIGSAFECARNARNSAKGDAKRFIALDIGPTGRMLAPYGDLDFEDAVSIFAQTVKLGVKHGADLIFIETMNDIYETKAALLAAKENSDLPVFVTNAYGEDGKLMTGASPAAVIAMLEGMGADAIGVNCSLGPKALAPIVKEYLEYSSLPVIMKPNAGLPKAENGKTVYDVSPDEFSKEVYELIKLGVRIAGGCCGTTPEYISALSAMLGDIKPKEESKDKKPITVVSSYTHAVVFGKRTVLIGERINPTGKKRIKEALRSEDMNYILSEGISQQEKGADILDVNVGLPEINEAKMLTRAVCELQAITDLPLQIDTSDPCAMEAALRKYNGKPLINSVNGKKESMDSVFPLAKKYGGVVVALTLDENGIPKTAEGRLEIAKRILAEAEAYGIHKRDIIFDPLALTVSADSSAAAETLRAVKLIGTELGVHTSLGVSNVSFGLPERDIINGTFFTMAMQNGLSAAIMNPYSASMMKAFYSFNVLNGLDESCADYISFASELPKELSIPDSAATSVEKKEKSGECASELQSAIIKGLKERAAELTKTLLITKPPLSVVTDEIIPALDTVGVGFENKTVYLPQLLMSAEAAKHAFEQIKAQMHGETSTQKCTFIIATVKGDIHDIGKNIVKLLLENYGFRTVDLGRDVAPDEIVSAAVKYRAPIVGLSALMTTTVPAMEEAIKALRKDAPWCRIVVGGAVMNKEYARAVGADKYAKDAMETVRYAEQINSQLEKEGN